jgi:hypothetical protein
VSNSVAISASSTDIQEINSHIVSANQRITNLATKEQTDVDDLQDQINDNLIELHILEEKETQDVIDINASIANLQNLINQHSSDITAIKSTDVTFTNEFITVSQELQALSDQHSSDITVLQGQITSNLNELNTLEAKEQSDIDSLTTQLNEAKATIATHTQNINALFSEDLTFSTEFTDISNSLNAQIIKEASDVATIHDTLRSHYNSLTHVESLLQLTSESLSEQITKEANDLRTTNIHIGDLGARITSLATKEENDVLRIDSALDSQLASINANTSAITALQAKEQIDYNTHESHLSNIDSSISTLNQNVFNNTNDIGTLTNQLTTIVGGINTNVSNLSSLESAVSSNASSIQAMQAQVTTIQQQADLPFNSAHEWTQQQTFDVPPVMSGANIRAATIPTTAIAGQFVDTASVQYIGGIKTFMMPPVFNMGLTARGSISFPDNSIPASCITGTPQGPKGDTGDTGPQGPAGPTGPVGPAGTNGTNGTAGANGPAGPQGPQGPAGANGTNGTAGAKGDTGATGPAGPTGATGASGASQLGVANTWTALQTFSQPPVMSGASITANTIPSSAIVGGGGGASLSTANTWTALQTFNSGIGLPTSISSSITSNKIGYTIYSSDATSGSGNLTPGNLTLGPTNSVWIINYVINITSTAQVTSTSSIYVQNLSGTNPQYMNTCLIPVNTYINGFYSQSASIVVGSTTSSNNFVVKLNPNYAAAGSIAYSSFYFWATRIA